jgi:hypothetical protein
MLATSARRTLGGRVGGVDATDVLTDAFEMQGLFQLAD